MEKNNLLTSVAVVLGMLWYQEYKALYHIFNELCISMNNTENANHSLMIFNQVPKTGSENMIRLIDILSIQNDYKNLSSDPELQGSPRFDSSWEKLYYVNMMNFYRINKSKIVYKKYMNFLNFEEFNKTNPIYVSMVRNPVERIISWYYYHRQIWYIIDMESDFPPKYYKESFEDCVLNQREPCQFLCNTSLITEIYTQKSQVLITIFLFYTLCLLFSFYF